MFEVVVNVKMKVVGFSLVLLWQSNHGSACEARLQ